MDEDKAPEEKEPENMDHDANKTGDPTAGQMSDRLPNASVAPSGQHKSKAAAGTPTDHHLGNITTNQSVLPRAADTQQSMGTGTGAVLQQNFSGHVSVEKKNVNKPVVLLSQTRMTLDGTA